MQNLIIDGKQVSTLAEVIAAIPVGTTILNDSADESPWEVDFFVAAVESNEKHDGNYTTYTREQWVEYKQECEVSL